jgi:glucokinase
MFLCFDLGGSFIKSAVIDIEGNILVKEIAATEQKKEMEGILKQFKKIEKKLLNAVNKNNKKIKAISVGIPGFVISEKGYVINAPNLNWNNIFISNYLEEIFDYPVFIINDANAAALGELWKGAGRGNKNIINITLGTGIGAGIILNGEIYSGNLGMAGEIGHFRIESYSGKKCSCGKECCLETESSGSAMACYGELAVKEGKNTTLKEVMNNKKRITSKDIVEAAAEGDEVSEKIIDRASYYLSMALSNIYLVTAPEKIIIGGGVAEAGEILFKPLRKWFDLFSLEEINAEDIIFSAELGNDAGIIGLAKYAQLQLEKIRNRE